MADAPTQWLDITGDVCPMTLVRVRMALDRVTSGGTLTILMAGGEPVASIPRALKEEGHEVTALERQGEAFRVTVRKK
ncbi:MAG: sulfurtransferase TusA family protein [Deferrisomatales bacterium]